ncbi:MAG: hypothetical protein HY277_00905, partial [Ignavibacteriales bacterium]|nr:hypothetical protein [Ignavibacteriales bacterium]
MIASVIGRSAIALLLIIASCSSLPAQWPSEFWIRVSDNVAQQDTAWRYFGNDRNATYGLDSLNPTIQEAEYPPPTFSFDARWVNIPGHSGGPPGAMGAGFIPFDYRGFPSNPTQKDTFVLAFQYSDQQLADFTFTWPDAAYLMARCDSMFLVDPTRCALPSPINMFLQNTVTLTAPQICDPSPVTRLRIYKYGIWTCDENCEPTLSSELQLRVSVDDALRESTTLFFGNHLYATYGLDSMNQTLREVEYPGPYPPPSFCFETHWVGIPGRPTNIGQGGMGRGTSPFDFRGLPAYPTYKDTFAVLVSG